MKEILCCLFFLTSSIAYAEFNFKETPEVILAESINENGDYIAIGFEISNYVHFLMIAFPDSTRHPLGNSKFTITIDGKEAIYLDAINSKSFVKDGNPVFIWTLSDIETNKRLYKSLLHGSMISALYITKSGRPAQSAHLLGTSKQAFNKVIDYGGKVAEEKFMKNLSTSTLESTLDVMLCTYSLGEFKRAVNARKKGLDFKEATQQLLDSRKPFEFGDEVADDILEQYQISATIDAASFVYSARDTILTNTELFSGVYLRECKAKLKMSEGDSASRINVHTTEQQKINKLEVLLGEDFEPIIFNIVGNSENYKHLSLEAREAAALSLKNIMTLCYSKGILALPKTYRSLYLDSVAQSETIQEVKLLLEKYIQNDTVATQLFQDMSSKIRVTCLEPEIKKFEAHLK